MAYHVRVPFNTEYYRFRDGDFLTEGRRIAPRNLEQLIAQGLVEDSSEPRDVPIPAPEVLEDPPGVCVTEPTT